MWKLGTCIVLLTIGGILLYDTNVHGSFEKSNTGRILKDTGALQYFTIVWKETKKTCDTSFKWAMQNVPIYYSEVCTYLKPYIQLLYELSLIFYNSACSILHNLSLYIEEKSPIIQAWVADYTLVLKDALIKLGEICLVVKDKLQEYTVYGIEYAKKNIFVGSMSPENLKRVTLEAINTTQVYATHTFQWVYEKFQTLSRLEQ